MSHTGRTIQELLSQVFQFVDVSSWLIYDCSFDILSDHAKNTKLHLDSNMAIAQQKRPTTNRQCPLECRLRSAHTKAYRSIK